MSLYPSLEDMKVGQLTQAQIQATSQIMEMQYGHNASSFGESSAPPYPTGTLHANETSENDLSYLYPTLNEYMGLEFTPEILAANMPEYLPVAQRQSGTIANVSSNSGQTSMIAPISGSNIGFQLAQVTHGIRELTLCKGPDGKVGVRVKDINKGIFVSLVKRGSPAALAGLKFGDQILQINGKNLAGVSMDTVHDIFRKSSENNIILAVRDRPFERTVTLHKDSTNHIGFQFKDGEIVALVKDSSAARNGLLINHYLLEVNGQNVVGLKDKDISAIINECGQVVTITIMPSFLYKHIVKNMSSSLVTKFMDHSIPDL